MGEAHNDYLSAQLASLPKLPNTQRLTDRVIRVLGGNPGKFALQGTNTYLLGTGHERILIDTAQGFPIWLDWINEVLADEDIVVKTCLLTHWHHDHTGGIADLRKVSPDTVFCKNSPDEGQEDIEDGQEFSVEGATVKAVFTPGHAYDHMCFVLKEENALFTGDNVLGHGTTVFEDLGTYMKSLGTMLELKTARAYPAHGAVIENSQAKIKEYIRHRQRREDQIVHHMQSAKEAANKWGPSRKGAITCRELVVSIYRDVDEALFKAAEASTVAVLDKLVKDGRVGVEKGLYDSEKQYYLVDRPLL